jgi:hypothetical protein
MLVFAGAVKWSINARSLRWTLPPLAILIGRRVSEKLAAPWRGTLALLDSFVASRDSVEVPMSAWLSTVSPPRGSGFQSDARGPSPYALGPVPPERCRRGRIGGASAARAVGE